MASNNLPFMKTAQSFRRNSTKPDDNDTYNEFTGTTTAAKHSRYDSVSHRSKGLNQPHF